MIPFWESNIMRNESMAMVQEGDEIYGKLLFVPKRIISGCRCEFAERVYRGRGLRMGRGY